MVKAWFFAIIVPVMCIFLVHDFREKSCFSSLSYERVDMTLNPLTAELFNWNFHSLKVVSR